jgi:CPA2 family monovalent cation:H+ antiporter-2
MGRSAFEALGMDEDQAKAAADAFEEMDRSTMVDIANLYRLDMPYHENEALIARVRELRSEWDPILREQMDTILRKGPH